MKNTVACLTKSILPQPAGLEWKPVPVCLMLFFTPYHLLLGVPYFYLKSAVTLGPCLTVFDSHKRSCALSFSLPSRHWPASARARG